MPKPSLRIESFGSFWLLDETELVYFRLPKTEGPRQSPPGADWGGADAGALQDVVWLPFTEWHLDHGRMRLIIGTPAAVDEVVSAPLTYSEFARVAAYRRDAGLDI